MELLRSSAKTKKVSLTDSDASMATAASHHAAMMSEAYFLIAPPRHGEAPASRVFRQWVRDEIAGSSTRLRREDAETVSGEDADKPIAIGDL